MLKSFGPACGGVTLREAARNQVRSKLLTNGGPTEERRGPFGSAQGRLFTPFRTTLGLLPPLLFQEELGLQDQHAGGGVGDLASEDGAEGVVEGHFGRLQLLACLRGAASA